MRALAALIIVLAVAGCTKSPRVTASKTPAVKVTVIPDTIVPGGLSCADDQGFGNIHEAAAILKSGGRVRREGHKLHVGSVVFADELSDVGYAPEYLYAGPLVGTNAVLVDARYYEGGEWIVVDDHDRKHNVSGALSPSPDGKTVVALVSGDSESYARLEIFAFTDRGPRKILEIETTPCNGHWDDADHFTYSTYSQNEYGHQTLDPSPSHLVRQNGKWRNQSLKKSGDS